MYLEQWYEAFRGILLLIAGTQIPEYRLSKPVRPQYESAGMEVQHVIMYTILQSRAGQSMDGRAI